MNWKYKIRFLPLHIHVLAQFRLCLPLYHDLRVNLLVHGWLSPLAPSRFVGVLLLLVVLLFLTLLLVDKHPIHKYWWCQYYDNIPSYNLSVSLISTTRFIICRRIKEMMTIIIVLFFLLYAVVLSIKNSFPSFRLLLYLSLRLFVSVQFSLPLSCNSTITTSSTSSSSVSSSSSSSSSLWSFFFYLI